jgi:hypothetical protein
MGDPTGRPVPPLRGTMEPSAAAARSAGAAPTPYCSSQIGRAGSSAEVSSPISSDGAGGRRRRIHTKTTAPPRTMASTRAGGHGLGRI